MRKIGAPLVQLKKTLAQVQACKGLQVFIQVGGQVQESGPEGWLCQEPPESAVAPGTGTGIRVTGFYRACRWLAAPGSGLFSSIHHEVACASCGGTPQWAPGKSAYCFWPLNYTPLEEAWPRQDLYYAPLGRWLCAASLCLTWCLALYTLCAWTALPSGLRFMITPTCKNTVLGSPLSPQYTVIKMSKPSMVAHALLPHT